MRIDQGEQAFVHQLDVEVSFLNENNIMKPSAYQSLFAQLAERHLSAFGADSNVTMQYGLAWALISLSIDIKKPIDRCMKLFAKTWYSQRKGPYFRRELVFCDENDTIMFQGSTFSVLLDLENRTIYRKNALPFSLTLPLEEYCIEAEPRYRGEFDFTPIETRVVYNSFIDNLGHVNNRYYGDFAFDSLTESELLNMVRLRRMDFYFISELRNKDHFTLEKAKATNRILINGQNITKSDLAFVVDMQFDIEENSLENEEIV